jgi:hypothetical protein
MTSPSYVRDRLAATVSTQPVPRMTAFAEPEAGIASVLGDLTISGENDVSSAIEPPSPVPWVEIGRGGAILFHDGTAAGREAATEVTTDTFYTGVIDANAGGKRASGRVSALTHLTLAVDLNAIANAVKAAQRNDGQPADPDKRVYVGKEGELRLGDEASDGERIAEVTGDTFYAGSVNLAAVAQAVRDAQARGGQFVDPDKRVYVSAEGDLYQGGTAARGERLSEVTGDTFFASRTETEAAFARSNMPQNTVRVSDGTYEGWHFTITNEFGDSYGLFLYYHPSYGVYRVALIEPRMEGTVDAHGGHLWPDGTLCLTRATGSGYPSMGATYAKAALWTRGASCYRRGYGFQFNIGQG